MRACFLLLLLPLLIGCAASEKATIARQAAAIDSLYVIERNLRADLYATQDSLLFYDDIDSGRYYREKRTLEDRINRLEYLVSVRKDSLCLPDSAHALTTLAADDLFEPASATLTEAGTERLAALADTLTTTFPNRTVRIEGHSDNVPVGPNLQEQYPSNWELSAARATAVIRYLVSEHGIEPDRLEAVALGDTHPIASNTTAAGRRSNRRIEVLVLPDTWYVP